MKFFRAVVRNASVSTHKALGLLQERTVSRSLAARDEQFGPTCDYLAFFADPAKQIYQLSQWIAPLESLAETGKSVGLVVMDPFVAKELSSYSVLPIFLTRSIESYEDFVLQHDVRAVFYVNNSQANFPALRITSPTHIHLNHGESDKVSMVSNQLKAYDFAFVAGEAAVERIQSALRRFDSGRLAKIGRPQLDTATASAHGNGQARTVVLYAPTWEGDSRQMAYGSLPSLGAEIVGELLADGRFTVVFRPHPKSGTWSKDTQVALGNIEKSIRRASALDPSAGHRVDRTRNATAALSDSDVVIADNSAMTMDAVGLDKPVLLTLSEAMQVQSTLSPTTRGTMDALRHIGRENLGNVAELVSEVASAQLPPGQLALRDRVFGAKTLGTGTERFIRAAKRAIEDPRTPFS